MFNFLDDTKPVLTKGGVPLGIYWGVTGLLCFLFLIGVYILRKPIVVCRLLDHLIRVKRLRTYVQSGGLCKACEQRSSDIEEKKRSEDGATEHKERAKKSKNGLDAEWEKEKPLANNKRIPERQSGQAHNMNGKSTSTDGREQGRSKSSAGWFRRGRIVFCGDNQV